MKKGLVAVIIVAIFFLTIRSIFGVYKETEKNTLPEKKDYKEISGTIRSGETLFDIFRKNKLDLKELYQIKEASAGIYRLSKLYPDRSYKIIIGDDDQINSFIYWIDEDNFLDITRTDTGFKAEKGAVVYEKKMLQIGGIIKDNLISSMGEGRENLSLALQISDIFAWDIDFSTDLRKDDTFKIVVEGLYLNNEFKKYGDVLSSEFINNGDTYLTYLFEHNGRADYYDEQGRPLRKAFLKAPLSFRRISSGFSKGRYHPILKKYRPHHGLDYAAPTGTPVSAVGDGAVIFSGYKGNYGKLVIIKHFNGYKTYYGHLSRIKKNIKLRTKVEQGQTIGYVGSTGLSTGPHLHYEIRINDRPVNPLKVRLPRGNPIPKSLMTEFMKFKNEMDNQLASIMPSDFVLAKK